MPPDRRACLRWLAAVAAGGAARRGRAQAGEVPQLIERYATTWRRDGRDHVALLEIDWPAGRARLRAEVALPSRAHGLQALPDGGVLVAAQRPGRWLLRLDADGAVRQRLEWAQEPDRRTLNGHVLLSADGQTLFSTETDPRSGEGVIAARALRTLATVAAWPSQGLDPHQMLQAEGGLIVVANGGIARDAQGRKREGEPIASSLVLLDAASGRVHGQWQLADRDISMRHLAWSLDGQRLGVALQAEHAQAAARAASPLLAVFEDDGSGSRLRVPAMSAATQDKGYAGDIAALPDGGFVLSAQRSGRCWWWQPSAPGRMSLVAQITEPCALAPSAAGVAIAAGLGAARWQAGAAAHMLAWPMPVAVDNHWVRLQAS